MHTGIKPIALKIRPLEPSLAAKPALQPAAAFAAAPEQPSQLPVRAAPLITGNTAKRASFNGLSRAAAPQRAELTFNAKQPTAPAMEAIPAAVALTSQATDRLKSAARGGGSLAPAAAPAGAATPPSEAKSVSQPVEPSTVASGAPPEGQNDAGFRSGAPCVLPSVPEAPPQAAAIAPPGCKNVVKHSPALQPLDAAAVAAPLVGGSISAALVPKPAEPQPRECAAPDAAAKMGEPSILAVSVAQCRLSPVVAAAAPAALLLHTAVLPTAVEAAKDAGSGAKSALDTISGDFSSSEPTSDAAGSGDQPLTAALPAAAQLAPSAPAADVEAAETAATEPDLSDTSAKLHSPLAPLPAEAAVRAAGCTAKQWAADQRGPPSALQALPVPESGLARLSGLFKSGMSLPPLLDPAAALQPAAANIAAACRMPPPALSITPAMAIAVQALLRPHDVLSIGSAPLCGNEPKLGMCSAALAAMRMLMRSCAGIPAAADAGQRPLYNAPLPEAFVVRRRGAASTVSGPHCRQSADLQTGALEEALMQKGDASNTLLAAAASPGYWRAVIKSQAAEVRCYYHAPVLVLSLFELSVLKTSFSSFI